MNKPQASSVSPPVALTLCMNIAGLIGLLAWGWIGATLFLLGGGGKA